MSAPSPIHTNDPGIWRDMIAHSPCLRVEEYPERVARRVARRRDAGPNEVNGSGAPAAVSDRPFHSPASTQEGQRDHA